MNPAILPQASVTYVPYTNFGVALQYLKQGKRVARAGWNGKGMFIFLNKGSVDSEGETESLPPIEGVPARFFTQGDKGTVTRLPNINMHTATGSTVTGWLASQTDLLAEDWEVLPD